MNEIHSLLLSPNYSSPFQWASPETRSGQKRLEDSLFQHQQNFSWRNSFSSMSSSNIILPPGFATSKHSCALTMAQVINAFSFFIWNSTILIDCMTQIDMHCCAQNKLERENKKCFSRVQRGKGGVGITLSQIIWNVDTQPLKCPLASESKPVPKAFQHHSIRF